MVKAGHPVKSAIAASLAHAHYSDGGEVDAHNLHDSFQPEQGNIGGGDDNSDAGEPVYTQEDANDGLSDNVMDESVLVQGLQAAKMKDNNNTVKYSAGNPAPTGIIKKVGLVEDDKKPTESAMPGITGEPMSEEMKAAIMAKKAKRRFS